MKTITRKITLFLLSALVFFTFSITTYAAQQKSYVVTVKNNQIFLNNKQLTKSISKKSQPVISPDNSKILFVCNFSDGSIQLGTVDTKTKAEKIIKINQEYTQIMGIEWQTSQKVGMVIHINPSLDSYQIYDVISGKNINKFYGYDFIFNKSKSNIIYISAPPHFSSELGGYAVMLDNSTLYKTDENTSLDNSLSITTGFDKIAFYEYNIKDEAKSNIVILSLEKNKVKTKNKITWNKNMAVLKWDNENILSIGDVAKYDVSKAKLTLNK